MNKSIYKNAFCLTAAALAGAAVPAQAEVYRTESQALGVILGDKAIVRREQKSLDAELRRKLEQSSNLRFPESTFTFFIAAQDGKPAKYAIVMNEIGKTEPITFMVGLSPEGKVTEVVIMEFRENRGWEVKEKRFLNQFRGKSARNAIRVDEDIINYTGATLSSKAVARGVKKALLLLDAFFPGESRLKLGEARDFSMPTGPKPITSVQSANEQLGLFRQVRYAMGTHCEIRVWCGSAQEARVFFEAGFQELERLEQIFSAYREDSELSHVNRFAGKKAVQASDDFFRLTSKALRYSRESNGLVDITVAPLLGVWSHRNSEASPPCETGLATAREFVGHENVILNRVEKSIRLRTPGVALDFGGIAKGYAAEQIAKHLEELEVPSALVNLGGSSLFASSARRDPLKQIDRWPIAVSHPNGNSQPPFGFYLRAGSAISTSGTLKRALDGEEQLSHIVNPITGELIEGICSVTVVAEDAVFCESASKEFLLKDSAQREKWKQDHAGVSWVRYEVGPDNQLFEESSGLS
ncbi:MAG TPA: FAD:protein FMN transferase [Candidatus Acidoferrum sp.]|nr:FAD:protein FMN transferase [Candidatus Acidoferrum sp.]